MVLLHFEYVSDNGGKKRTIRGSLTSFAVIALVICGASYGCSQWIAADNKDELISDVTSALVTQGIDCKGSDPKAFAVDVPHMSVDIGEVAGASGTCTTIRGNDEEWRLSAHITTVFRAAPPDRWVNRTATKVDIWGSDAVFDDSPRPAPAPDPA